jgi:hypothetical protein
MHQYGNECFDIGSRNLLNRCERGSEFSASASSCLSVLSLRETSRSKDRPASVPPARSLSRDQYEDKEAVAQRKTYIRRNVKFLRQSQYPKLHANASLTSHKLFHTPNGFEHAFHSVNPGSVGLSRLDAMMSSVMMITNCTNPNASFHITFMS